MVNGRKKPPRIYTGRNGVLYINHAKGDLCPFCQSVKKVTSKVCGSCRKAHGRIQTLGPKTYAESNPDDRPGVIYKVTNTVNGKLYIGKTSRGVEYRWRQHLKDAASGKNTYLYRSIRKYGKDKFTIEIIDSGASERELDEKEIRWIAELDTINDVKGYNCTNGGEGRIHSPSSRACQKGVRVVSKETKAKLRAINIGRKQSPEAIEKMAVSRRGKTPTPEAVISRSEGLRRRYKNDAELRARTGRITKEWYAGLSAEKRAEWLDSLHASMTPEYRAKLSAAQRNRWTPEMRAAWSSIIKANFSVDVRKKCSSASKDWWDSHPEAKIAMSNRVWSEESRAKARAASMKRWSMREAG